MAEISRLLSTLFLILICLWVSSFPVLGHGYIHSVLIDGQEYPGWNPFSDPYFSPPPSRVVRKVQSDGFVSKDDPDLPCHHDGNSGSTAIAEVNAGSTVVFQWSYWPSDHQGPVSTYMAWCNGDCTTFSAAGSQWFKLDAGGYDANTRQWAADKLRADNNSWTSTVPADLMPGQYLIRNEIIALHSSPSQHYPSCVQLNVRGQGKGYPSNSDLVYINELYKNTVFPNIYSNFGTFTIPGPPPVSLDAKNPPFTVTTTPSPTAGMTMAPAGTGSPGSGNNPLNQDTRSEGVCRLVSRKRNT